MTGSTSRLISLIKKEWEEGVQNKMVLLGVVVLPLFFTGFSVYFLYQYKQAGDPISQIILLNQTMFYFLLLPVIIPLAIAVYAIVGEKDQGSLEPLLATPLTDFELFLGKALASVIPALLITWISFGLFVGIAALLVSSETLPAVLTLPWLLVIFALSPLISIFSVTVTMAISSRVNDTRAAYQLSSFALLPILVPLIFYSTRKALISLSVIGLEAGIVLVVDIGMLYLGIKIFKREEILTRWR